MADSLLDSLQKTLSGWGLDLKLTGRYGRQKMAVIGGYIVLCLFTIGWAVSSSEPLANAIGARIESKVVALSGEQWFLLRNESSSEWTDTSIVLNTWYIHHRKEPFEAGASDRVFAKDFRYLLYVPRAQHFGTLEDTSDQAPGPNAPTGLEPETLIIHTAQGTHRMQFVPRPKAPSKLDKPGLEKLKKR